MALVDLLLLTDGRAPLGAYAHSYGLESAVIAGDVSDVTTLHGFVAARLVTTGHLEASAAAAVRHRATGPGWGADTGASAGSSTGSSLRGRPDAGQRPVTGVPAWMLEADREVEARLLAPATRTASRALGRHLLRLAQRTWPDPWLDQLASCSSVARGWHQPVVLGVVGAVMGATEHDVATASLYGLASGLSSAGVRLLGLDPLEVHAVQARLADTVDELASEAVAVAPRPLSQLPATGSPLADIRAQAHAADPSGRLFTS